MSLFSGRTAAIALTTVFGAAALVAAIKPDILGLDTGEKRSVCVDNILIPQTVEQAEYLQHHAAEAYAAADQKRDPKDPSMLAAEIARYKAEGKTATVTGFDPHGASSTLPDGTKRPVGCYTLSVK